MIVFIIIPLIGVVASKMREMAQPAEPAPARSKPERTHPGADRRIPPPRAQRRGGQPAAAEPQPAEILADEDAPVGGRVGQQVQKYMDTSDFRRRSEELGGEVAQADQQFTQHVGQAFSGEVSRLASRPGEAAQPVEVIEAEVAGPEYLSRPPWMPCPKPVPGWPISWARPRTLPRR